MEIITSKEYEMEDFIAVLKKVKYPLAKFYDLVSAPLGLETQSDPTHFTTHKPVFEQYSVIFYSTCTLYIFPAVSSGWTGTGKQL
jgi:hypothetical protein